MKLSGFNIYQSTSIAFNGRNRNKGKKEPEQSKEQPPQQKVEVINARTGIIPGAGDKEHADVIRESSHLYPYSAEMLENYEERQRQTD